MKVKEILEANKEQLVKDYLSGTSTCELGRQLNISNASVYLFLRDTCGVDMNVKNWEQYKEEIIKLNNEGLAAHQIGIKLGIPKSTISRLFKRWGLKLQTHKKSKNLKGHWEKIKRLRDTGLNYAEIARVYMCHESNIGELFRKMEDNNE